MCSALQSASHTAKNMCFERVSQSYPPSHWPAEMLWAARNISSSSMGAPSTQTQIIWNRLTASFASTTSTTAIQKARRLMSFLKISF